MLEISNLFVVFSDAFETKHSTAHSDYSPIHKLFDNDRKIHFQTHIMKAILFVYCNLFNVFVFFVSIHAQVGLFTHIHT